MFEKADRKIRKIFFVKYFLLFEKAFPYICFSCGYFLFVLFLLTAAVFFTRSFFIFLFDFKYELRMNLFLKIRKMGGLWDY